MTLKDAFELVPNEYRGNRAIVYLNNKPLIGGVFAAIIDFPFAERYKILTGGTPFNVLSDRENTIVFHVKE